MACKQHVPPEHYLVLSFGRVICDFWSACLFANHLTLVYARLEQGVPPANIAIVAPKVSYQHLAEQERRSFQHNPEIPFRLLFFWEGQAIEDVAGERRIARIARIPAQPTEGVVSFKIVPIKVVHAVMHKFKSNLALPADHGVDESELAQLFSLGTFYVMLFNVLRASDFIVGFNVSLRESFPRSTFGLLGPLNNNAVLRLNMTRCTSFADLLLALFEEVRRVRQHAHYPYALAADKIQVEKLPIQVRAAPAPAPPDFFPTGRVSCAVGCRAAVESRRVFHPGDAHWRGPRVACALRLHVLHGGRTTSNRSTSCFLQSALSQHAEQASHQFKLYLLESADMESDHVSGGFSYRCDLYADDTVKNLVQRFQLICEEVRCCGPVSAYHCHAQAALDPTISLDELSAVVNTRLGRLGRKGLSTSPDTVLGKTSPGKSPIDDQGAYDDE